MKRQLLFLIFLIFVYHISHAQTPSNLPSQPPAATSFTGVWSGEVGQKITLVFHFETTTDGQLQGTMDSPDQGAMGLPFQTITFQQDSITCTLKAVKAHYTGTKIDDSTLKGYWYQSALHIPLTLHRLSAAEAQAYTPPPHPQTPHAPYPYHSDSVEYDNADKSVHLAATLTYPETGSHFHAVILITGSGTQDRDEAILGHRPFAVIADYLTRHGYAVLRVDDRQAGLSRGNVDSATTLDFAKDVETSLAWLKKQKQIDPKKIGLIGHSEGGMIAPIVASRNKDVAFIISLAGPLDGYSTLMYQRLKPMQDAHVDDKVIAYEIKKEEILINSITTATNVETFVAALDQSYRAYYAMIPDSSRSEFDFIHKPDVYIKAMRQLAPTLFKPWWKFFISYKAEQYYKNVKCPVLLLGGEKDVQVDNNTDIPVLASILKDDGNQKVQTRVFPGLNHLFQHCKACTVQEYSRLEETFAPETLTTMSDWLDKTIKTIPTTKIAQINPTTKTAK